MDPFPKVLFNFYKITYLDLLRLGKFQLFCWTKKQMSTRSLLIKMLAVEFSHLQ